jgi:predicted transposase YbfD/YdcC
MGSLIKIFRDMPGPRCGNAQRHDLLDILTIALVASVCLALENGLPSHDTFSRVFRLLDPAAFGRFLEASLVDLGADGAGVLAIDGKTLRRSFDRAAGRSALHVVTAFGADARLSLGQRAVAPGENEITAARALLATLTLAGALVTGDAVHAQAETAQLVLDRGGDYLFALKANRPAMLDAVAAFFADPAEPLEVFETTDADHGRIETRRHRVTHSVDWLFGDRAEPGARPMPGLATLACVEAVRDDGAPATRYYLSSAASRPRVSPAPSARTGPSRTACTGCWT